MASKAKEKDPHGVLLDAIRGVIATHNEKARVKLREDDVITFIVDTLGGSTESSLRKLKVKHLTRDHSKVEIPELIAEEIIEAIKGAEAGEIDPAKLPTLKLEKLFDLAVSGSEAGYAELERRMSAKAIARGRFVVKSDEGTLIKEASLDLLRELFEGEPSRAVFIINDEESVIPLRLSSLKGKTVKEKRRDPLHEGSGCYKDGGTHLSGGRVSWAGVNDEIQLIIATAVDVTGEIEVKDPIDVAWENEFAETAKEKKRGYFARLYPRAAQLVRKGDASVSSLFLDEDGDDDDDTEDD